MFPSLPVLRSHLKIIIANRRADGHVVDGLHEELNALPDSFDALDTFAHRVANLPVRSDWRYVEPDDLEAIWRECDPARPLGMIGTISADDAAARVETAFLSSVCGCIVGKPVEANPTLQDLRTALEAIGEWPLRDYISERIDLFGKKHFHPDAPITLREKIRFAAPDDDINYTVLGMLNLEQHGLTFTYDDLRDIWLHHVSMGMCWGPEQNIMVRIAESRWGDDCWQHKPHDDFHEWTHVWNPHDELCGALIRADAYGYACPGNPSLAAELAWRDASFTHRKTGIYGTMFAAAAIAAAFVVRNPLEIFRIALQFIPQRSRFHHIVSDSLAEIAQASGWLDGYARIHGKYKEYSHCMVYQECGTLINTLRFATDIGDGFCKQVSQGNDTDSFGATAGSILGAYFGPGHLEPRWLAPFNDEIRTGVNCFYERSLSALAKRMARLPALTLNANAGA
jgi:ADP-ribosylglycohydrolase